MSVKIISDMTIRDCWSATIDPMRIDRLSVAERYAFARAIEERVMQVLDEVRHRAAVALPLADYEAGFINNVRTVVDDMRESIREEERRRLIEEIPQWLRKEGV